MFPKHDAISSILKKRIPQLLPVLLCGQSGRSKTAEIYIEGAKSGNAPVKLQLHLEGLRVLQIPAESAYTQSVPFVLAKLTAVFPERSKRGPLTSLSIRSTSLPAGRDVCKEKVSTKIFIAGKINGHAGLQCD